MHVCMVSTGYLPLMPKRVGAVEPFVYGLSRRLSIEHTVDVFGLGQGCEDAGNFHVHTFTYPDTISQQLNRLLGRRLTYQGPFNAFLLKQLCSINKNKRIDIIHLNDANSGFAASAIGELLDIPWVCSIHNEIKSGVSLKKCSKVLAVSNYLRNTLIKQASLKPDQVSVLNVAIDPVACMRRISRDEAKKQLGLIGHSVILFVGRKCPEKGPQILLSALAEVKKHNHDILAVLVGPDLMFGNASNNFTIYLRHIAKVIGIEENVLFVNYINDDILALYYQAADIVVFPSVWQEPFGKVILEAMSFETPVIASAVGGVPEIIENQKSGLLCPSGDTAALASSINFILSAPDVSRRLSDEGRRSVLEKYSFLYVSQQCVKIYKELL